MNFRADFVQHNGGHTAQMVFLVSSRRHLARSPACMMLYYQCEQRSFGRCSIYLGTILFLLLIQFVLGLVFIANLLYIYQKRRQTVKNAD